MPLADISLPNNTRYIGQEVPDACTVAEWKRLLEDGRLVGEKILWARRLRCSAGGMAAEALEDADALPTQPQPVFVYGPDSVITMLDLALRKVLHHIALGRGLACASQGCCRLVHSEPWAGGYCCGLCSLGGSRHDRACQGIAAPPDVPRASATALPAMPADPKGKYKDEALTHDDLRRRDQGWQPPSGEEKQLLREQVERLRPFIGSYMLVADGCGPTVH